MGLAQSSSGSTNSLTRQQRYKLIRRYNSDSYGDLTVAQNKQNNQYYALKQLITQDQLIFALIQKRKNLKQKTLVLMEQYWYCGEQQSICSNIRKIQMVFRYYQSTIQDQMKRRAEEKQLFTDFQIVQIFIDVVECLKYLEDNNFLHLVGSMKMLLYDKQTKTIKLMQNQEMLIHSQHQASKNIKKQLNIICLIGSKKILPLHPLNEPKDVCDVCLSSEKIAHQNLFTLGLICIGLCWMKDPLYQLGVYGKGGYIFQKINKRIHQIKNKYPCVYRILSTYMGSSNNKKSEKFSYSDILGQAYAQRKSFTKQNDKSQKLIQIQPLQKVGDKRSKKLSYLRQMRLSNNDIPSQF